MAVVLSKLDKSSSQKPALGSLFQGKKVLVVDDNVNQRKRLRELYESLGFEFAGEAGNGLEAIESAEKLKPDLISLDILMPVMHGLEALGYLRESGSNASIVFVSALGNLEILGELRSLGFQPDAVFSKKDTRDMFFQVLSQIFKSETDPEAIEESEREGAQKTRIA
jgi:two-component system, chemotaxis family, chemotaxis protein CheY